MTKLACFSLAVGALLAAACRSPDVPDLNNPPIDHVLNNPGRGNVAIAAQGLLIGARANLAEFNGYVTELGVFGRESYIFDPGDNRFVTELLNPGGLNGSNPRFGGNMWTARYANIRSANLLMRALNAPYTKADSVTTPEKEAVRGFAKTIQALDFLEIINTRDTIGAPIDVDHGVDTLAPFVPRNQVFDHIIRLLDSAQTHLQTADAAGAGFPFQLTSGFTGFSTPATFLKFNRAFKARVQVYRGAIFSNDLAFIDAINLLADGGETFLDTMPGFDLDVGVFHTFGTTSGDITNGLFDPTPAKLYAHPSLLTDAELQNGSLTALDRRYLAKVRSVTFRSYVGHGSSLGFIRYASNVAPLPIIRNEELILLRAEANLAENNVVAATGDINFIRVNSGGLAPILNLAVQTPDSILTVLLKEKRYSLLFEGGHRWLDARHYGRLGIEAVPGPYPLPIDIPGDQIYLLMPVPLDECLPRPAGSRGCP